MGVCANSLMALVQLLNKNYEGCSSFGIALPVSISYFNIRKEKEERSCYQCG